MIIAYNDENKNLKILIPALNINIKIIAEKDVPEGILYKILNESEIPSRDLRNFYELDINETNADGKGLSAKEFYEKYPQYKDWAVK